MPFINYKNEMMLNACLKSANGISMQNCWNMVNFWNQHRNSRYALTLAHTQMRKFNRGEPIRSAHFYTKMPNQHHIHPRHYHIRCTNESNCSSGACAVSGRRRFIIYQMHSFSRRQSLFNFFRLLFSCIFVFTHNPNTRSPLRRIDGCLPFRHYFIEC